VKPNKEMVAWFEKRTQRHIDLVQKYAKMLAEKHGGMPSLRKNVQRHDASKFKAPEREPYIFVTWMYKCKRDNVPFFPSVLMKKQMNDVTEHHILNNMHHPEAHDPNYTPNSFNHEARDEPGKKMVNAMLMGHEHIAEMVADWGAVSEERGTSIMEWADKNIDVRWKFTKAQKQVIYSYVKNVIAFQKEQSIGKDK